MALVGKCCFVLPLRTAVLVIGFTSMVVSFMGLLASISSVLHYFSLPKDPLLASLMQVVLYTDVEGIVFHSILFIVSTVLAFGAIARVCPLLVPWLGWSPMLISIVFVQMVMVILREPDLALPVVAFCCMVFLFVIYASIVIVAHYREATLAETVQLRIFSVWEGDLPRIVAVPRRFLASRLARRRREEEGEPMPMATLSTVPLTSHRDPPAISVALAARERLTAAYARLAEAINREGRHPQQTTTTRF